jgi:glycosyltransferase involved in cell wall biosynthesis
VRTGLGIDPAAPVLLSLARQEHQKAQVDLLAAIPHLLEEFPSLVLLLAGKEGAATPHISAALDGAPVVTGHVRVLGHRTDVGDLLTAADCLVISSRIEGTAGVAIEAMAMGTPIVSTDVAGQRGVLEDERNALVVPIGDPRALSQAIARVLAEEDLRRRLSANGRSDFTSRFTLDAGADALVHVYREVAHRAAQGNRS